MRRTSLVITGRMINLVSDLFHDYQGIVREWRTNFHRTAARVASWRIITEPLNPARSKSKMLAFKTFRVKSITKGKFV